METNVKMVGMTEDQRTAFITKATNAANELGEHIDLENTSESLVIIATSRVKEGDQIFSGIVGNHDPIVKGLVHFIEKYPSVFHDAVKILAVNKIASLNDSLKSRHDEPSDAKE